MPKLEELKAAYEAATPGEWNNTEQSNGLNSVYGNCQFDSMADADLIAFDLRNGADAEFITLAHNMMPDLLEAVELLKDLGTTTSTWWKFQKKGTYERELYARLRMMSNKLCKPDRIVVPVAKP